MRQSKARSSREQEPCGSLKNNKESICKNNEAMKQNKANYTRREQETFWAPLKTTAKAYAKQQAMRCQLAYGESGKTFWAPLKTTAKA